MARSRPAAAAPRFAASVLVFDLDGTLVHTGPDLAAAVNRMLASLGRDAFDDDTVFRWLGNGAARLVQRALTGDPDGVPDAALFERGHELFMRYYRENMCVSSAPYPHVERVLADLRATGFRLACLTNKPQTFTLPILGSLGLDRFFDMVVAGDSLPAKKPDPMPLRHILETMGVAASAGLMVGDSITDIRAAKAAGLPVICVSFGYNQGLDLTKADPDAIIDSFADLPDLVEII